jgi:hypothetical protein
MKFFKNGSRTSKLKTVDGILELKKQQIREFVIKTMALERF